MSATPDDTELRAVLSEIYTPEGVELWLNSRNTMLDGARPIDLVATGRYNEVLDVLNRIADGNA